MKQLSGQFKILFETSKGLCLCPGSILGDFPWKYLYGQGSVILYRMSKFVHSKLLFWYMITLCLFWSLVSLILNCKLSCVVICVWTRVEIKKSVDIKCDCSCGRWLLNPQLNIFHYSILSNMKFKASPHNCTIESEHLINSLVVCHHDWSKENFLLLCTCNKGIYNWCKCIRKFFTFAG